MSEQKTPQHNLSTTHLGESTDRDPALPCNPEDITYPTNGQHTTRTSEEYDGIELAGPAESTPNTLSFASNPSSSRSRLKDIIHATRRKRTIAAASLALVGGAFVAQEVSHGTSQALEIDPNATLYPDNPDGSLSSTPGKMRHKPENLPNTYQYKDNISNKSDGYGYVIGGCQSYVVSKLKENKVNPKRYSWLGRAINWPENARKRGELVDNNPAAGAAAHQPSASPGHHVVYVDKIENGRVYFSDYNGGGGSNNYYSWSESLEDASDGTYTYIHYELPNDKFESKKTNIYENLQRISGRSITTKSTIPIGSFIASKDDRYRLVVNKGDLKLYDTASNDAVRWSAKTNKRASIVQVKLGKGKNKGKNTLAFSDEKRDYKKWNIGNATKIQLGVNGNLEGYNGKRKVWSAESISRLNKVAKLSLSKYKTDRLKAIKG